MQENNYNDARKLQGERILMRPLCQKGAFVLGDCINSNRAGNRASNRAIVTMSVTMLVTMSQKI